MGHLVKTSSMHPRTYHLGISIMRIKQQTLPKEQYMRNSKPRPGPISNCSNYSEPSQIRTILEDPNLKHLSAGWVCTGESHDILDALTSAASLPTLLFYRRTDVPTVNVMDGHANQHSFVRMGVMIPEISLQASC